MVASTCLTRERARNPTTSQCEAECQEKASFSSIECLVCVISVRPGNIHFMLSARPQSLCVHGDMCDFGQCVYVVIGIYTPSLMPLTQTSQPHNDCGRALATDRHLSWTHKMTMDTHMCTPKPRR